MLTTRALVRKAVLPERPSTGRTKTRRLTRPRIILVRSSIVDTPENNY